LVIPVILQRLRVASTKRAGRTPSSPPAPTTSVRPAQAFPNFKDGRAYSQARILRERYRFRGELRATGQILRDQFPFLIRAGFDAFEVTKPADAAAFAETIGRYSVFYQPATDGLAPALRRRLANPAASDSEVERLPS
jgi:hypothetical protein